jgi:phage FluMu protein Com
MKSIQCHHCNYEWNYKGSATYECACPRCRYRVQINWTEAELIELIKKKEEIEGMKSEKGVDDNRDA